MNETTDVCEDEPTDRRRYRSTDGWAGGGPAASRTNQTDGRMPLVGEKLDGRIRGMTMDDLKDDQTDETCSNELRNIQINANI